MYIKENFSYSKVSTYKNCPLKYELSYIKKIKLPKEPTKQILIGYVLHDFFKNYITLFLSKGEFPSQVDDLYKASLRSISLHNNVTLEYSEEECRNMEEYAKTFISYIQSLNPVSIKLEENFYKNFKNNSIDVTINGRIDCIVYTENKKIHIFDIKTTNKNFSLNWYMDQLYVYAFLLSNQENIEDIKIYVFFPFLNKGEIKEVPLLEANFKEGINSFFKHIEEICLSRRNEPVINKLCEYCDYFRTDFCKESQKVFL